jgi:hypothetical protein
MRKRTERALQWTRFTEQSHPLLVALIDFAAQSPGMESRNYGSWESYCQEASSVARQWRRIVQLLDAADHFALTDAQVLEASQSAFSGRLHWDGHNWDYCTGQYFPVEYRAAVIAVLAYALPRGATGGRARC